MALSEYQRKRDFTKTPEPAGSAARAAVAVPPAGALSFVVQKHAARRLHYDFRLELDGVLKSWAVPKGPSADPAEKRLAVHVEDHPLEYGGFEGVIPQGNYGAGASMIWDHGTWTPLDRDPQAAYAKGALKFELHGHKLHGKWALVRMAGRDRGRGRSGRARGGHDRGGDGHGGQDRENWLLIKERDAAAAPGSGEAIVADNPRSAATGRTIEEIAADRDRIWGPNGEEPAAGVKSRTAEARARVAAYPDPAAIAGAKKARMPAEPRPLLACAAADAPDGPEWLHEIKYDGYRLLAQLVDGRIKLLTRGGLDWTAKFRALAARVAELPTAAALIDGEIMALEPDGISDFGRLQDAIATERTEGLVFYAFDLLYLDGWDLRGAALEDRKRALAALVPADADGILRYSDHQIGRGREFFRHACGYRLEGIVAKRRDSTYRAGRHDSWLKIKCANREEFVVIGFSDPAGGRQGLGALLLGYYDPSGELRYAGRVGTGFSDALLVQLRRRLDRLVQAACPVKTLPKGAVVKGVHWTRPELVAEIRYAGWTSDAVLRHAAFEGLREDKSAKEVMRPMPSSTEIGEAAAPAAASATAAEQPTAAKIARDGSAVFEGVRLTHAERVLYPAEGLTKLDLARYYAAVADWALPHLKHRVLSLVRAPNGVGGELFYQKHAGAAVPAAVRRIELDGEIQLAIEDLAGLLSLVQIGVLEIHPWGSTVDKLEQPDRITFDLDPDEGLPWQRVTEAAIETRDVLAGIGLTSFAKTTGGKGLHVVVPLAPRLGWDEIKAFTKAVVEDMAARRPDRYVVNQLKRMRRGRIYLDYLRNGRGATAVGAYSTRARPGATVSTPLFWDEVEAGIRPETFTVATIPSRLASLKSDPWAEIATLRQQITAAARKKYGL
jgi:bifunctional non-homologous end joining protein LigD